ncbi:MAG: FG-GAP-like repeat-containing protein [Ignavibacteria bacterium]|nr:FG-GAP-like repeat-containing protein [Ignavibacteria bacterium]
MKKIYSVFVMLSVLLTTTNISAQVSFSGPTNFTLGNSTNSLTYADVNADGKQDIIATRQVGPKQVTVLLNTSSIGASTPTFSTATDFTVGGGNYSTIATADFNNDGKPDIVASEVFTSTVRVLLNTTLDGAATPSFSAYTSFATGTDTWSVTTSDVNGDGKPDMVTANLNNTVSVLLNTTANGAATPTFTSKTDFTVGAGPYSVAIGDVNGDGKPDVVTVNSSANTVSVLLNTTANGAETPSFTSKTDFAVGNTPYSVEINDLNGDNKPDIVTGNQGANTVSVLLNTTSNGAATPTFSAKTDFAVGTSPVWVTIADFDGDNKPEIVTANQSANTISVLLNTTSNGAATPTFSAKTDFAVGTSPSSVANADFNGDNKPDIVTSNTTASVLLNTTDYIPLPVELTSFSASIKNKAVNLAWQTATEVNNYGFEIERSVISGQLSEWEKIGFVNGGGNSNSPKEYSFTDPSVTSGSYAYRLKQLDNDGKYEYSKEVEVDLGMLTEFSLQQNYPNPFNPETVISYQLPVSGNVSLKVFDMLGREVVTLVNEVQEAGMYDVSFNGKAFASGAYIYRFQSGNYVKINKMVLMK